MAEEVQIISTLDNKQTIKALTETEKQVNDNTEALLNANDAVVKMGNSIVKESKAAQKTLRELEKSSSELTEELLDVNKGTKLYAELRQELIQVNKQIKNVELSFEALDSEQVASEVGSAIGGLTDVATGAFLTFGVAEESAEEFFKVLVQVEGAGRLVKGSIEGIQSASKLYNNVIKSGNLLQVANTVSLGALGAAQGAYAAIVGTSTGGLKLFRIALIGTGIGAIIVGLGLLIANFDDVKDIVTDASGAFGFIAVQIEMVTDALQALGIIASKESERLQLLATLQIENLKEQEEAIGNRFQFEIDKAKAAGKNTIELEKIKRKAVIESLKAQAEAIISLVRLSGEFTDDQKTRLKEISDLAKKLSQENIVSEIKNITEVNKKASDARKKRNDKAIADEKKRLEELARIANELVDLQIASIEDEAERELAILDKKFNARIEKLKQGGEEEVALAIALEKEKARQIAELNDAARLREEEKDKESNDKRVQQELTAIDLANQLKFAQAIERQASEAELAVLKRQADLDKLALEREEDVISEEEFNLRRLEVENAFQLLVTEQNRQAAEERKAIREEAFSQSTNLLGAVSSLNQSLSDAAVNNAEGNEEKQQRIRKKSFERNKKIQIGLAVISGIQGVLNALTAQSVIPEPFGTVLKAINAAAVGAAAIANISKIRSTKFNAGGGASATTSTGGGGGGSGASISPIIPELPEGAESTGADEGGDTQAAGSNQVVKAFVVETEMTDQQAAAKLIEEKSELT